MDLKEYKTRKCEIERKARKLKNALAVEYALSNNDIKIGDVVTDHIGTVRVESIGIYLANSEEPRCTYKGICYTEKGVPYKSGEHRLVYQENLRTD